MWDDFALGNQPLFSPGVSLDALPDDGSRAWEELYQKVRISPVRE